MFQLYWAASFSKFTSFQCTIIYVIVHWNKYQNISYFKFLQWKSTNISILKWLSNFLKNINVCCNFTNKVLNVKRSTNANCQAGLYAADQTCPDVTSLLKWNLLENPKRVQMPSTGKLCYQIRISLYPSSHYFSAYKVSVISCCSVYLSSCLDLYHELFSIIFQPWR